MYSLDVTFQISALSEGQGTNATFEGSGTIVFSKVISQVTALLENLVAP